MKCFLSKRQSPKVNLYIDSSDQENGEYYTAYLILGSSNYICSSYDEYNPVLNSYQGETIYLYVSGNGTNAGTIVIEDDPPIYEKTEQLPDSVYEYQVPYGIQDLYIKFYHNSNGTGNIKISEEQIVDE